MKSEEMKELRDQDDQDDQDGQDDFNEIVNETIEKKTRKYRKSFYTTELVNVTSAITAINKFITLHPEFFKTNVNKKIVYFNDNQVYSIYTEPLWFKDTIHKVNGYITTDMENNSINMKVHINKNLKNKECYVKQIENYVNYQTKYGNNVELNYYKILSDTIIKHCYYNEPIEQWNKDVILVQNEFFSPHKQYLFSIINNKVKHNGVGNTANSWNNLILHGLPGSGKCLKFDTPIIMYDGSIKKIQDIKIGEFVMGDDSTPRKVLELSTGEDEMFEVSHVGGDSYTVNSNHILSLVYSGNKSIKHRTDRSSYQVRWFDKSSTSLVFKNFSYSTQVRHNSNQYTQLQAQEKAQEFMDSIVEDLYVDIPIKKYMALNKSTKDKLKGYKVGIDFEEKPLDFDPYIIGLWLGDGNSCNAGITNQDATILHYLVNNLSKYNCYLSGGKKMHYSIRSDGNKGGNMFLTALKKYKLINNKHIPKDYKINSRNNRLKLLAGLIDSDGYYNKQGNVYEIVQKNMKLAEDIVFLCKSLGFKVSIAKALKGCWVNGTYVEGIYNRIGINGENLEQIPVLCSRKKASVRQQIKNALREGITVRSIGIEKYYGFELNGNHRFVLGNFIVTHNSSCIYRISMMLKLSIISVDISLYLNKKKELYSLFHGQEFSLPNSNNKEPAISNAIIVLEEFDHAMSKLLDIENIFKYKDVIKREYLTMKNKEIKVRTQELVEEYTVKNVSEEKSDKMSYAKKLEELKKLTDSGNDIDYDKFVEMEMLNDGFDMQNNKVHDKARQNVLKKRDFDNEICGINAELNNIIRSMDDDNKSNILRLSDMLELFQGPVPIKNRIVMATTNNFEKIRDALPALFRSGRMSPIHFDYLDWGSLNELCVHYFEQNLSCEARKITIPTSQIIELAIKHVLTKKSFEEFEAELVSLL